MVEKGTTIKVGLRPVRLYSDGQKSRTKKRTNWDDVIAKSLSATTSILGLVLLFNQINN